MLSSRCVHPVASPSHPLLSPPATRSPGRLQVAQLLVRRFSEYELKALAFEGIVLLTKYMSDFDDVDELDDLREEQST